MNMASVFDFRAGVGAQEVSTSFDVRQKGPKETVCFCWSCSGNKNEISSPFIFLA